MISLRKYQSDGIAQLRSHVEAGRRRLVYAAATGSGKTCVAASIVASSRPHPVLFVAHRIELIDQAVNQIRRAGVEAIGVIRADDERTNALMPVQVASKDTLVRRALPPAALVFIDECHRAMGAGYQRIIAGYPDAVIIGLTATPWRLDGKPLGDTFEALVQTVQYSDLIEQGAIVKPMVYSTKIQPNLSKVHTRQGDYATDELEVVMLDSQVLGSVVDEWRTHSAGRHSVVFACTIAHSQGLVEKFKAANVRAAHLDGETPLAERRRILADLEAGHIEVVSNVGVLCEGWDQPSVKCISIARPTQSLSLYMQMAGRSLRPFENITPVIIDHGRNVDRHGLPHEDRQWDLLSGVKPRERAKPYRLCPACFAYVEKNPCELCGHSPPVERREVRTNESEKLEKREQDPRVMLFDRALEQARSRGFKPGYAAAKYKEKYEKECPVRLANVAGTCNCNHWPPWSWSDRAKAAFAQDEAWQKRVESRTREREYWQAKAKEAETDPVVEVPDDDGTFRVDDL